MIKIICVGKIKEKFFSDAITEYVKRLSKFSKLEIVEVLDEGVFDKALKVEGERILRHIKDGDFVVTMEIDGNSVSSVDFSSKLDKWIMNYSNVVFVIGGSYGLSSLVKERSNYQLSFSKMTFPHQLFRVILLEQIYRAFKIINNESYHK